MFPSVKLTRQVVERLDAGTTGQKGIVYGIMNENTIVVVGLNFGFECVTILNDVLETQHNYPTGVDWCGFFEIAEDKSALPFKPFIDHLKSTFETRHSIYLRKVAEDSAVFVSAFLKDSLAEVDYEVGMDNEVLEDFMYLRIKSIIVMEIPGPGIESILDVLHTMKMKTLKPGIFNFHFKNSNLYVLPDLISLLPSELLLLNLMDMNVRPTDVQNSSVQGLFEVEAFVRTVADDADIKLEGPVIAAIKHKSPFSHIHLPIEAICIVRKNLTLRDSYIIMSKAMCRWLDLTSLYIRNNIDSQGKVLPFRIGHYFPKNLGHYLTHYFPLVSDDNLVEIRKHLHCQYNLSLSHPYFRLPNVLKFGPRKVLFNVHRGLRHEITHDRRVSLVKGDYGYYHYMQNKYDDRGWGCAYRSFQTIFSWFRCQGYTDKVVPSHKDIQECLVKIGDKPSSFIGSKTWIGSTEISYCLDDLIGTTSVILRLSSGSELKSVESRLEYHFHTAGTPIMIGGGSLAHTILGVDINESTGDTKFLILDPHYVSPTDEDVLKHVQNKGGIFWKGGDFWSSENFYNLCLPQLPICF